MLQNLSTFIQHSGNQSGVPYCGLSCPFSVNFLSVPHCFPKSSSSQSCRLDSNAVLEPESYPTNCNPTAIRPQAPAPLRLCHQRPPPTLRPLLCALHTLGPISSRETWSSAGSVLPSRRRQGQRTLSTFPLLSPFGFSQMKTPRVESPSNLQSFPHQVTLSLPAPLQTPMPSAVQL